MIKLCLILFVFAISGISHAENLSALEIDYLKVTENQIIADAMLEMEPALIQYYQKGEYVGSTEADRLYALRHKAYVLGQDHVSEYNYQVINEVAPDIPLKFLQLNKEKYPNLWRFGNIVRLKKEKQDSLMLYRALHGKDYQESQEK